ncbi:CD44 antigen isoform X2 [Podarcis raffonei]|uniref:CD44 antigen isoform X2 n=1 Tax=Podarcis raffonei TaxID=65483 RepID=UPI0023293165|nr:CD44 antigen isoform X2 [Podarcis raffonei]
MAKVWLGAAVGFYLLQLSLARIDLNISCRYAGVFHVEKNRRYSLSREEAIELCKALNSTLPTWDQMQKAYDQGFETCRYGYIEEKIVVPRHTPYALCAANHTGIYVLSSNISDKYDTYCFNSSESRDIVCDPVIKLYSIWPDEDSKIEIYNPDGSHYIDGERFTKRPPITEDENIGGSGSANDRSTTDPNVISPGISSRFPHHTDDGTFTSKEPFAGKDEDATDVPNTHDGHHEGGHSKDQQPQSPNLDSHEKQEDPAEEYKTPGLEGDKYGRKTQLSPSITGEVSNNEKRPENSTQVRQVPEEFPSWWQSEEHKEVHNATSRKAVSPHHNSHEKMSTSIDFKEVHHPIEGTWDKSSEEDRDVVGDDDGGGDDDDDGSDDDDDDDHYGEGSGHLNPETVLEWNSSGDNEPRPSKTTVVSTKDVKHDDSAHDSFLHGVHSEKDSEVRYSTNGTREDVLPRIVPVGDDEHYSTATAGSSSDDFFKQEDSTQNPLDGALSGLETEDTLPTTIASDVLHPVLVPSSERERTLEEESSHHTVLAFNESAEHEESPQDQLSAVGKPGRRSGSATNRTILGVLETLIPQSEKLHDNESSQTADNGMKVEESTQGPPSHGIYPEWSNEERYPTNSSSKETLPEIIHPSENEQKNESIYTVVSSDSTDYEDSGRDTMLHSEHSGQDNEEKHLTNTSGNHLLPGILHAAESEHENERSDTAVASSDNGKQEDTTQKPHAMHPGWESEDEDTTNTTMDNIPPIIILSSEGKHEKETHHTAVVSDGGSDHEDSTQEAHPGQNNEHRHPSNTSTDYFVPGIISSVEYMHGNETSHIAVGSSDDIKHEVATRDPTVHDIHHESGREDDYSTNSTKDEVPIRIIPPAGNNNIDNFDNTAVIHNDHEDSTQQPLPPIHQPGWYAEEIYPTNTSRDGIPMGVDSDSESKQTDVAKEDSTPEPVRQWGHEDKYTTKSTADVLVPGIVPRRGISQKNNTDHTAVVSKDGTKTEESTQDPQLHGLRPEWSTEDEPVVNGTQDYVLPGVFPEIDSGSDRHPSSPTASVNPNDPKGSGRGTHIDQTGESPKSEPRMAIIPDWLIVVASLLALALILGVCIAVNSRRRCGQKQKLIINNGKGGINEKNKGGLNGEASRSREMVHLVHDEKPENQTDEFQAIDETQNQQEVALKSGV